MAASPKFKVFDSSGTYQAACKEPEAAAALLGFYGDGAKVKLGHSITVYTQGADGDAAESYDAAAALMLSRC